MGVSAHKSKGAHATNKRDKSDQQMNQQIVSKLPTFKTFKERGEWVELCFMARVLEKGFKVSKPWGDSIAYDIGVDNGRRVLRVQVKSTTFQTGNGYLCRMKPNPRTPRYTADQLDFFAAYVIPKDAWYLIPSGVILRRRGDVMLCPVRQPKYRRLRGFGMRVTVRRGS